MGQKYIFTGTARSGKTTAAKEFRKHIKGTFLDVLEYVVPYLRAREETRFPSGARGLTLMNRDPLPYNLLKKAYQDLQRDLERGKPWDILEIASDWPEEFLPWMVRPLKGPVVLIFLDCPVQVCLARNRHTQRKVPEDTIKRQASFGLPFYRDLAKRLGLQFYRLDTNRPIPAVWKELKAKFL